MSKYDTLIRWLQSVPSIQYVTGNRHRSDFVFVSNKTGIPVLYRWDQGTVQLLTPEDEPITGFAALHSEKPYLVFAKGPGGTDNFALYFCDYKKDEITRLTDRMGIFRDIFWVTDESWIVIKFGEKENSITLVTSNTREDLFITDEILLPPTYDDTQKIVAAQIGRGKGARIVLVDITGNVRWISESDTSEETNPHINPEKGLIVYKTDVHQTAELVVRSIESLYEINRVPIPEEIGSIPWFLSMAWVDKHTLLVPLTKNAEFFLRLLDIKEGTWSHPVSTLTCSSPVNTKDGLIWTGSSFNQPPCIQQFNKDKTVTTLYEPELTDEYHPVEGESHWYTSFDGRKIQGWLLRAPGTKEAPLVVVCHGGPHAAVWPMWGILQELVLAGFHVFAPNFRGSATFGPEFENLNIGDPGGGDLKDVLYGAHYAMDMLNVNTLPGIVGGSYGGYLVMQAMTTHPEKWAGGVAFVPVVDLAESHTSGNALSKAYSTYLMGGTPEEKPDLYKDRSPITHVENIKSPVLIIAGENDPLCPLPPIKKFYKKAQNLNLPVELEVIKGEGHGVSRAANAFKATVLELEFLEKVLTR